MMDLCRSCQLSTEGEGHSLLAQRRIPSNDVCWYRPGTETVSPKWGRRVKGREGHRVNTQIQVLRIVSAATAAFIIFLIVHNALQAFSQASSVLSNA